ncbi:GAF domain-containing sensor histidine kinase [Parasediminibacterium paludis]|uniref:histidine kinase n=1 Tax=Parasediminibacterium paludis TaxID=908966 RepID=A0ABV8PZT4_9BACT
MNIKLKYPIPANEEERLWALSEFDVDYTEVSHVFKDLVLLAAKIAKTEVSLVNLIDSYTQWSVSNHGLPIEQMERTESVCQYTITTNDYFEVKELSKDERFKDKAYVVSDPKLDYYFGVPLTTEQGYNLGALCVMDKTVKDLSPEKIELLKIVGKEVVNRLVALKTIQELKAQATAKEELRKKVAHDIRGPLGGIISLTQIISMQGENNKLSDVLEFINMIQKAGTSLLDLATEILNSEDKQINTKSREASADDFSLETFKQKLERLYLPQAKNKAINYTVSLVPESVDMPFPKNKLLQITGNLITNAIKFTPANGSVSVMLGLSNSARQQILTIKVADTGVGLNNDAVKQILSGNKHTSDGTDGEAGFGFGLALVKRLVDDLHGTMHIDSVPNEGTTFTISLQWTN